MPATQSRFPKRKVRLDCGKYIVRTITIDDASDRWASWMADPEASDMLNAPAQAMTKSDIVAYIESFDQRSRLLLGIFETATGKHLGFLRIDIDHASGRFLVSMLIGEPNIATRASPTTSRCRFAIISSRPWASRRCSRPRSRTTARSFTICSRPVWVLDQTIERHVKSHSDDRMLDLCFFSLTREAWRDWKKANLGNPGQTKPSHNRNDA